MSIITLDEIKAAHDRVSEMITSFEAAQKNFFEFQGKRIALAAGEIYAGTIIRRDAAHSRHIILLPGDEGDLNWTQSMSMAEAAGGELPDRAESALLFATLKDEFEEALYWTREQHASYSDCAWCQRFSYGFQDYVLTNHRLRARVVRRLPIL